MEKENDENKGRSVPTISSPDNASQSQPPNSSNEDVAPTTSLANQHHAIDTKVLSSIESQSASQPQEQTEKESGDASILKELANATQGGVVSGAGVFTPNGMESLLMMQQRQSMNQQGNIGDVNGLSGIGVYPQVSLAAMQAQHKAQQQQLMDLMMGHGGALAGVGLGGGHIPNMLQNVNSLAVDAHAVRIQAAARAANLDNKSFRKTELDREDSNNGRRTFPLKLHEILADPSLEAVISWAVHGRAWRVHDTKQFALQILPRHFKHSSYKSFTRQVNFWGFNRITSGPDQNFYYHEYFLRGNPDLCRQMLRKKQSNKRRNGGEGPDFYQMPSSGEDLRVAQHQNNAYSVTEGSLSNANLKVSHGKSNAGYAPINAVQQQNQMLLTNNMVDANDRISALSLLNRGFIGNEFGVSNTNIKVGSLGMRQYPIDFHPSSILGDNFIDGNFINAISTSGLTGISGNPAFLERGFEANLLGRNQVTNHQLNQLSGFNGSFNPQSEEGQRLLLRQALFGTNHSNIGMLSSQQLNGGMSRNIGMNVNPSILYNGNSSAFFPGNVSNNANSVQHGFVNGGLDPNMPLSRQGQRQQGVIEQKRQLNEPRNTSHGNEEQLDTNQNQQHDAEVAKERINNILQNGDMNNNSCPKTEANDSE